jgi:hypothetical protein
VWVCGVRQCVRFIDPVHKPFWHGCQGLEFLGCHALFPFFLAVAHAAHVHGRELYWVDWVDPIGVLEYWSIGLSRARCVLFESIIPPRPSLVHPSSLL